ncbi:MAG: hypothetical protein K0S70_186 [Microbacterium sp.]|jgi:hypothetical protein|nr:hypothetical protein [Microbacterium sp.]
MSEYVYLVVESVANEEGVTILGAFSTDQKAQEWIDANEPGPRFGELSIAAWEVE